MRNGLRKSLYRAVSVIVAACLALGLAGCGGLVVAKEEAASKNSEDILVVTAEYVLQRPDTAFLVDSRTKKEYAQGHIPGAINIKYSSKSRSSKSRTPHEIAEEQLRLYEAAGIKKTDELIIYCRGGKRARAAAKILMKAGYEDVKVYVGGWEDWTSDPHRPIETVSNSR